MSSPLNPLLVLAAGLVSAPAHAQQEIPVWFGTDFDGGGARPYADPVSDEGMRATWEGDGWRRRGSGGVSPTTDEGEGSFGAPADAYENFLLIGDETWTQVVAQTVVVSHDDDGVGLVARHSDAGHYYSCSMSRDRSPSCQGDGDQGPPALRLARVDTNRRCRDDYVVAAADGRDLLEPGRSYLMHLQVLGGQALCAVDLNGDGRLDSPHDLFAVFDDPDPLPGGAAGIAAYDSGGGGRNDRTTTFHSFVVGGLDDVALPGDAPEGDNAP